MSRSFWAAAISVVVLSLTPGVALAANRTSSRPSGVGAGHGMQHPRTVRGVSLPSAQTRARPVVLGRGSGLGSPAGSRAVRSLQRRLVGLGFSPGPVDGRFGPLTTQAVERLQEARGLAVDGIVGPQTRTALGSSWLFPGAGLLQPGGSRPVRTLQHRLSRAGFSPGPVDGRFGPLTTQAVERFQHAHDLGVDGIVGVHTQRALAAPRAGKPRLFHAPRAGGPQRLHHPAPAARRPHANPAQRIAPGGHSGLPWVILGLSVAALIAVLTGIRARTVPRREPATKRRPAARNAGKSVPLRSIADRVGGRDPRDPQERVRTLQRHLAWLGFEPGPVDGRHGPLTTGAVMRFQHAHNLPVDGELGPLTVSALRAQAPLTARTERVKALQTHLTWLGLNPGPIDGQFGPRTGGAVTQFQQTHNLNTNGRVGPETANVLRKIILEHPHALRTIIVQHPHENPNQQRSEPGDP
jgi:peptidoglycan hydrolase-like protein with peptidoglycan-binding domain